METITTTENQKPVSVPSKGIEPTTGITLNILEIIPSKEEVMIFKTPFKDYIIKEYRKKFKQHYFHRDGNVIYAWNLVSEPELSLPVEFKTSRVNRVDHTLVFNKILESALEYLFKSKGRDIYKPKYSSAYELKLQNGTRDFQGLLVIPILNFAVHPLYSVQDKKQIAALSLRYSTKYKFAIAESEIIKRNIDTRDWTRNAKNEIAASRDNTKNFLLAIGQKAVFDSHIASLNSDENTYKQFVIFVKNFKDQIIPLIFMPEGLKISDFLFHHIPNSNFKEDTVNKPKYYFYQDKSAGGRYTQDLLIDFKPYTFDYFNNRESKIVVITKDIYEGTTETFIKKVEERLRSVFHLTKLQIDYLKIEANKSTYSSIVDENDCSKYDLAIVVVSGVEKTMAKSKAPYFLTKAKLINEKVPTQELTIEVMKKQDKLIYDAVALNIYSKMGGTAWTVEQVPKAKAEIIIGISSTVSYNSDRIIGFANIFDYNGNYLIGDCSTVCNAETYADNLEQHLTAAIKNIIGSKNLQPSDPIRLIFHLTKEAGKEHELKAIDKTLSKFSNYDIQFGIVHLSFNHNYRLYKNSGKDTPVRGSFVQLSHRQALLHMGAYTKIPILIQIDKRSNFVDIYDASKQVLYFCHLCYRNFKHANVPVTIKYPALMAKLRDDLSQVPSWNVEQLNKVKDKLWFI